ncbi:MAG: protease inhibitor I42 family protein, partial [Acidobacteriia bacterium]|nr:protease inhibitor I42 family protein [Terriglobia bacterium]
DDEMFIGDDFNGRTIDLRLSETVEIRLSENPTTGFRWDLTEKGEPACALRGDRFVPAGGPPGASGQHSWTFQAVHLGECEVELVYHRRWQEKGTSARRFRVRLRVASDGRDDASRPSLGKP